MSARRRSLLRAIRKSGSEWSTARVVRLYQGLGVPPQRSTARRDLDVLARRGLLIRHDYLDRRFFTLNRRWGAR